MNWLRKFMFGRYGADKLNLALIIISFIISFVGNIFSSLIILIISYVILMVCIFRMLSKNITARMNENQKFLKIFTPIENKVKRKVNVAKGTNSHKHYECSKCKQIVRVPRGRGRIEITCPKCKNRFVKKT